MSNVPEPPFTHLLRMSDDTGLLEHARGSVPRRYHGYCVDDVARGLVVLARQPAPPAELVRLSERYLAFVAHAQSPDGRFRNRLGYDRRWEDAPDLGDWWGRALWGLGTAAARSPAAWIRRDALTCFDAGAGWVSPNPRSMAFAALGAAEILAAQPGHEGARKLLTAVAGAMAPPAATAGWPWPEPRLTYANAALPEAMIVAGHHLGDARLLAGGLHLLGWLLDAETTDGHLSVVPVGGWQPPEARPGFHQQPIEVATLADACARAFAITGDARWATGVMRAVAWFMGDNDAGAPLFDAATGGGCDGLRSHGCSDNQGAESTLALISTFQHGRRLAEEVR